MRETIESSNKAKRNNIELRITKGMDGSKVMVLGDAAKLVQVLTNLIVNSINYGTEGDGQRCATTTPKTAFWWRWPTQALAFGKKTCRGVRAIHRVDKSRSQARRWLGFGVGHLQHIIETHGQTINVRSTYGEGSTFSFTLRRPDPAAFTNGFPCFSAPTVGPSVASPHHHVVGQRVELGQDACHQIRGVAARQVGSADASSNNTSPPIVHPCSWHTKATWPGA